MSEVGHILCWAEENRSMISAVHIPGVENWEANFLSRQGFDSGEWPLHPEIFHQICCRWGTPDVDLMASWLNSKVPKFIARSHDSAAIGADALVHSWRQFQLPYIFPPLPLLLRVIKKIRAEGIPVILIAPDWPRRAWYAELVQLVTDVPWQLPNRTDLFVPGPHLPPELRGPVFDGMAVESWVLTQAGFSQNDKVVLRTSPSFLPKVVSSFHLNEEIVLPSLCPAPVHRTKKAVHTLDLWRQHNTHGPVSPNDWLGEKDFTEDDDLMDDLDEESDGCLLDSELTESKLRLVLSNGANVSGKKIRVGAGSRRHGTTLKTPKSESLDPELLPSDPFFMDSEDDLQIDETPRKERKLPPQKRKLHKFPRKLPRAKPCSDPNRVREPGELEFDVEEDYTTDEEMGDADGDQLGASSGGILDLLKASRQVGGPDYSEIDEAPASPSTQEAIQGMLCMANLQASSSCTPSSLQAWWAAGQEGGATGSIPQGGGKAAGSNKAGSNGTSGGTGNSKVILRPGKRPVRRPAHRSMDSEEDDDSTDEQETLGACFKDSEY
ncbi:unnamed protein product, partial [Ranitomeya imitator]